MKEKRRKRQRERETDLLCESSLNSIVKEDIELLDCGRDKCNSEYESVREEKEGNVRESVCLLVPLQPGLSDNLDDIS